MLAIYISTLDRDYSRTGVYFNSDPGEKIFIKFPVQKQKQFKILMNIRRNFQAENTCIVIMSPNHSLVPLFRILTNFKIVLDAGWPLSDSRNGKKDIWYIMHLIKNVLIDYLSFTLSHRVLLESKKQVNFVRQKFKIKELKLLVFFTGFNEVAYKKDMANPIKPKECSIRLEKEKPFILFRGKYNPESGLEMIISTARLLENKVIFVIATNINIEDCPTNVILIKRNLEKNEIVWLYKNCEIVLGQLSQNARLERTLPHKLFEAAYFSKCYISSSHQVLYEFMSDLSFISMLKPNIEELSRIILGVHLDVNLRRKCETNIKSCYQDKSSQTKLGLDFRNMLKQLN